MRPSFPVVWPNRASAGGSVIALDNAVPTRGPARLPWDTLVVVAVGGALGSLLRYWISLMLPGPLSTLLVNVLGCLAIGVLMFMITDVVAPHRLVRPFVGVGLLGGFTTYSTYVADVVDLVAGGQPVLAACYLVGTVATALAAVAAGIVLARAFVRHLGQPA